jgi:putative heme-binding domain-containing protein
MLMDDAKTFGGGEEARLNLLDQLAQIVGARGKTDELTQVLDQLANGAGLLQPKSRKVQEQLTWALGIGLRRSGRFLAISSLPSGSGAQMLRQTISNAVTTAQDDMAPMDRRLKAILLLELCAPEQSRPVLVQLLEPRQPQEIQIASLRALTEDSDRKVADLLLERFAIFAPAVREVAVNVLLSREAWTRALLEAVLQKDTARTINAGLIEPARQSSLLKHRDPEISRLAHSVFRAEPSRPRAVVVADYLSVLQLKGDAARGRQVFVRECKSCHQIGEIGTAVGPDLTGSPSSDSTTLLHHILDPNASVLPRFVQYLIADQRGRTYNGIIESETGSSLVLRGSDGAQTTLLRSQVDAMTSTGQSLMPEGVEKKITKQEMADLIGFLRAAHRAGSDGEGPDHPLQRLDIGTMPGLIEPDE